MVGFRKTFKQLVISVVLLVATITYLWFSPLFPTFPTDVAPLSSQPATINPLTSESGA